MVILKKFTNDPVLYSQMVDCSQHLLTIDSVPIPDQVLWRFIKRESLDELKRGPVRSRRIRTTS